MGKILIIVGAAIVLVGLVLTYFPQALSWFGNLPGDIKVDKPNMKVYIPITSMILLSILFSVIMRFLR